MTAATSAEPQRFGIFLAPFHPCGQNPTLALERDLELIQRSADVLVASRDWAAANRPEFIGAAGEAIRSAIERHAEERAAAGEAAG